jgi:Trypsin
LYTALDTYGYSEYAPQQAPPIYQPQTYAPTPPTQRVTQAPPTTRRPTTQAPPRTTQPPLRRSTLPPNTNSDSRNSDLECGRQHPNIKDDKDFVSLVISGKSSKKGQFPWLAAFFYNGGRRNGIVCGGSLVSSKVVITAAHCVHDKGDQAPKKASNSFFYLGKYDIKNLQESDYKQTATRELIVHPNWRPFLKNYDADIAAAVLAETIQFSNFIRPICLWAVSDSYNDMIDKQGTVAGWGVVGSSDEPSDIPYFTELKVVDERTCTESNRAFEQLISYRTFCAGSDDGRWVHKILYIYIFFY